MLVWNVTPAFIYSLFFQEAQELWKRIQARQGVNKWRPDLEEEYEDKEGNIYNKKTYTDLQRQGLIWSTIYCQKSILLILNFCGKSDLPNPMLEMFCSSQTFWQLRHGYVTLMYLFASM